ncbi:MAG: rhodanese-like domain-containing protein [Gammaproteobacteria bacterium]|nr:rhodanese-like domain-containing protein [Gammaproteobacteria bacterium]
MQQLIEFAANHMILVAALGAAIVFIITTEIRLRGGARSISTHETVRLINDRDAILVDVRDSNEYKTAHILNARNIPLARLADDANNLLKDKSRPIIVYCRSGTRTNEACKILTTAGYQNVAQLKNGFLAWQEANLPIEK